MSAVLADPAPAVLARFADAAQLAAAFGRLASGASVIYATGPSSLKGARNATTELVGKWLAEGCATCAQGRDPAHPGQWLFKVYRIEPQAPRTNRVSERASERGRVLALLHDCAKWSRPCPSNEGIAEELNLSAPWRARYLIQKLEAEGAIRIVEPARFGPRVIEIVASGLRTAAVTK